MLKPITVLVTKASKLRSASIYLVIGILFLSAVYNEYRMFIIPWVFPFLIIWTVSFLKSYSIEVSDDGIHDKSKLLFKKTEIRSVDIKIAHNYFQRPFSGFREYYKIFFLLQSGKKVKFIKYSNITGPDQNLMEFADQLNKYNYPANQESLSKIINFYINE